MSSCAVALNSAVLSQMIANTKSKIYCDVCDCMVVGDGHADRCRPKGPVGWTDERRMAWTGDTVHRLDLQLVAQFLCVPAAEQEEFVQRYVTNAAQARYVRVRVEGLAARSDHYAGTIFESRYFGVFRRDYLRECFPAVFERVLSFWQPPFLLVA